MSQFPRSLIRSAVALAALAAPVAAVADSAPAPSALGRLAEPGRAVLAIQAAFPAKEGDVRVAIYDEDNFLEQASQKRWAPLGEDGVAVIPLEGLTPGAYAFVAYFDENGDGVLNRGGVLGKPREPIAFSNDVKPKLRRPRFDEAKVDVAPGAVVVLTLED